MKKNMNMMGVLILLGIFLAFYLVTTYFLDRRKLTKEVPPKEETKITEQITYEEEKSIVKSLYDEARILYDVVNNKFIVDQDNTITSGDNIYKKITNFDEVTKNIFTANGVNDYISDLNNYFIYNEDGYYLIGNLVNYQTYYFRGDETNIFILDTKENEINAIIYERWTSNNKNTLATIKVINEEGKWLVDDIDILKTE